MHWFIQSQLTKCLLSKLIIGSCTQGSTQIGDVRFHYYTDPTWLAKCVGQWVLQILSCLIFLFGPQWRINYSSCALIHSTWISQGKSHLFKWVGARMSVPSSPLMVPSTPENISFCIPLTLLYFVFVCSIYDLYHACNLHIYHVYY